MKILYKFKNFYQKLRYGFCDDEILDLDLTITKYLIPRLKRYKELQRNIINDDQICAKEEKIIDTIMHALEIKQNDLLDFQDNSDIFIKGMKLFAKHFNRLWI